MNWDSHRQREQNVPEPPATHLEPLTFHWCIFTVFLTYCTLTISVTLLQISHFKKNNTWTPSAQHFCHKIKSTLRGLHFYQSIFCLTSHHFRLINAWPLYNLAYFTFTIPVVSSSSWAHFYNGKAVFHSQPSQINWFFSVVILFKALIGRIWVFWCCESCSHCFILIKMCHAANYSDHCFHVVILKI